MRIGEDMERLGYTRTDILGVRLAVEEALVNSIKHGHGYDPQKHVTMLYLINPDRVLFRIKDEGEGFHPGDVPDPTAMENLERPSGRGLLLMRSFLTSVRYSDGGTCVTLCKTPSAPLQTTKPPAGKPAAKTTAKTLVVEDNELARDALKQILLGQGFDVETAEDGRQALNLLRQHTPPDVILLDMLLPVMDGWQFLREFNGLQIQPKPRVVITTGSPGIGRDWAADHGCGGFVRKPVGERELLDEVRRCLNQRAGFSSTQA